MSPVRIQRQRVKGWRMPEGAIYVGRPSRWGNPYRAGDLIDVNGKYLRPTTAAEAVARYRADLERSLRGILDPGQDRRMWDYLRGPECARMWLDELRGRDLACWCPITAVCHADVLLELSNAEVARG